MPIHCLADMLHPHIQQDLPLSLSTRTRCEVIQSNIPGTHGYWKSAFNEFEASSQQQSHVHNRTPAFFHTGSMAEFHEYDLRCLLALYVSCLTCLAENEALAEARTIMTNDADFVKAVQKYKHVVTHYFAAKTEIWMALFMKEVYGVTGGNLSNKFAPSRGCIHFHSVLQAAHRALRLAGKELRKYANDVAEALKLVDKFIEDEYGDRYHAEFPTRPDTVFSPHGLELRKLFCNKTVVGKQKIQQFDKSIEESHEHCERVVGNTIEHKFGYSACHVGSNHEDFLGPVGIKSHNYRQHN